MADTSVTERRIRPIQDLLSTGNYKQALKECEKWQKKGESSDRFLALKAAVLLRQQDDKQQDRGAKETLQLCQRTPPVLNFEAIHQLQDSLKILSLEDEEGPKLWERAAAAKPNDEGLITTWLNNTIAAGNWRNAQKATMALRKAFPKERKYDYWNILLCYLIHEDERCPEKDRKLFGTLANRMIMKAAQPGQGDKAISSPEELSILAAVLNSTGTPSDLLEQLQDDNLKTVKDQDPGHYEALRLQAVRAALDSPLAKSCIDDLVAGLTAGQTPNDDDRTFALIVETATSTELQKSRLAGIEKTLEAHPNHRQVLLARLDLQCKLVEEDKELRKAFLDACHQYYTLFSKKAFCFDDLISRLRRVGVSAVKDFSGILRKESGSATALQQLFNLKLDYNILFADETSPSEVFNFVARTLTFSSTTEDDPSAAEAYLIAAMALLCAHLNFSDTGFMLQASMVLQTGSLRFKDYYPLRVMLMQLQMVSGHMHLGMHNFMHLSIKNLQWETLGHFVLTRISTLHPCQHGRGEKSANPIAFLDTALTMFDNSERSLNRAILDGLNNGSYGNVIDTVEVRTRLERSIAKQIYVMEERKCQRALKIPATPKFDPYRGRLSDLRDDKFMPVYGLDGQRLTDMLRCGPRPGQGWLSAMTLQESLMTYLMAEVGAPHPSIVATAVDILRDLEPKVDTNAVDLTEDERHELLFNRDLTRAALQIVDRGPDSVNLLRSAIDRIKNDERQVGPKETNGIKFPNWQYLHHRLVKLEILQNAAHFSAIMLQKFKQEKDKTKANATSDVKKLLEGWRSQIDQQADAIHKEAKDLKDQLSVPGVLGKLVDAVLGRSDDSSKHSEISDVLSKLQDEAAVEEYCSLLRESWEDALDGILAVRIKTI